MQSHRHFPQRIKNNKKSQRATYATIMALSRINTTNGATKSRWTTLTHHLASSMSSHLFLSLTVIFQISLQRLCFNSSMSVNLCRKTNKSDYLKSPGIHGGSYRLSGQIVELSLFPPFLFLAFDPWHHQRFMNFPIF